MKWKIASILVNTTGAVLALLTENVVLGILVASWVIALAIDSANE